jgi:WD40 repeat protein
MATIGTILSVYQKQTERVAMLVWSPDGIYLASGSWDKTVHVWEATTGATRVIYQGHQREVQALVWSPDGNHLTSGSWDKTVHLWEWASGKNLSLSHGHVGTVFALAWSPDGRFLAARLHQQIASIASDCHLSGGEERLLWAIKTEFTLLWAALEDIRPEKLRNYGPVCPQTSSLLTPGIKRLIELALAINDVASGKPGTMQQ